MTTKQTTITVCDGCGKPAEVVWYLPAPGWAYVRIQDGRKERGFDYCAACAPSFVPYIRAFNPTKQSATWEILIRQIREHAASKKADASRSYLSMEERRGLEALSDGLAEAAVELERIYGKEEAGQDNT